MRDFYILQKKLKIDLIINSDFSKYLEFLNKGTFIR